MNISLKTKERVTEELNAFYSGDDSAMDKICKTLDPLVRAVARRWKEDTVVERCDVEQELRILLIKLVTQYEADAKDGDEFVRIFISACKRKMGRIDSEETGIGIPYTSRIRKQRSQPDSVLPSQCSFDAINDTIQSHGTHKALKYEGPATPECPEEVHQKEDARKALASAIEALPTEERAVTKLRLENVSVKSMIEQLNMPYYTVYRRLHSAEKLLAEDLSERGYSSEDFLTYN